MSMSITLIKKENIIVVVYVCLLLPISLKCHNQVNTNKIQRPKNKLKSQILNKRILIFE